MYKIEEIKNKIICGDCLEELKKIPDNSVDCIITSPPYWSCRSYLPSNNINKAKEIGLEEDPQEYVEKIVKVSEECIRVLKETGVFFLNIGDVFNSSSYKKGNNKLKPKSRLLLPFRIAVALQDKGIIIRDVIIWAKKITKYPEKTSIGTTMPFPVKDRLLPAYEYVFQIVKTKSTILI